VGTHRVSLRTHNGSEYNCASLTVSKTAKPPTYYPEQFDEEGDIPLSVSVFKVEDIYDRKYLDVLPRFYRL
jgi:hypothetical protein